MAGIVVDGLSPLKETFKGEADVPYYDFVVDLGIKNPEDSEERYTYCCEVKKRDIKGGIKETDIKDIENGTLGKGAKIFELKELADFNDFKHTLAYRAVALMHESSDRAPPTLVKTEDLPEIRNNIIDAQHRIGNTPGNNPKLGRIYNELDDVRNLIDVFSGEKGETIFNNCKANMAASIYQSSGLSDQQKLDLFKEADLPENPGSTYTSGFKMR